MSDFHQTLKLVSTPEYEVELLVRNNGKYCVRYERMGDDNLLTQDIDDLSTALYMFDLKISEMEKNDLH